MAHEGEKVGYRSPPVHSRFKPGQSGNPSGKRRPKPTLSQLVDKILAEKLQVIEGGAAKRMDKEEVFLRQMVTRAIGGDRQYGKLLLEYLTKRQASAPAQADSATDEFLMTELVTLLGGERGK